MAFQPGSIQVNRTSPVPLYFQVAQELERAIEDNRLQPGDQLDNELLLADQLGLSRPTMRRALQYLVDKGYLVRRRGIGTQVVHRKVRRPIELTSLYDDLESSGQQPTTTVLSLSSWPPPTPSLTSSTSLRAPPSCSSSDCDTPAASRWR